PPIYAPESTAERNHVINKQAAEAERQAEKHGSVMYGLVAASCNSALQFYEQISVFDGGASYASPFLTPPGSVNVAGDRRARLD
ncbi:MAG: hypothetical protein WCN95_03390, partial [bacterium]